MATNGEKYVCTLDATSLKIAKDELNEDAESREKGLETLRKWVEKQEWIQCPTGESTAYLYHACCFVSWVFLYGLFRWLIDTSDLKPIYIHIYQTNAGVFI